MMHEHEQFTPERVDEQIEAVSQEHSETEAHSPNTHLVSILHEAYREDSRIVERVWMRLAEHVKNEDSIFRGQKDERNGRILDMSVHQRKGPQPEKYSMAAFQEKAYPFQRIGTLVAILFVIALVGSFVVVARMAQHVPSPGAHTGKPVLATPTLAQTVTQGDQSGLYVATSNGIDRLNLKTGKTLWHVGSGYALNPVIAGGTVYYVGRDTAGNPYLAAVNATAGTLRWRKNYDTQSLQIANGIVYNDFCDQDGSGSCHLVALNASNGAVRWTYNIAGGSIWMNVQNGVVYGISYSSLFALNATTGVQIWLSTLQLRDQQANMVPLVSNMVMYFASCNTTHSSTGLSGCYLYAYNATNGKEIWHFHATGFIIASPTIVGDAVYFGTGEGIFYAVDSKTGALLWHYDAGGAIVNPLQAVAGIIYAETWRNNSTVPYMLALNVADKTVIWTEQLLPNLGGTPDTHPTVIYNGLLYTLSGKNSVVALSLQNGTQVKLYSITNKAAPIDLAVAV